MRPLLFSTLSAWARQSALSSITRTRISDTRHALPLANQEVDRTRRSRRCPEAVSKVLQGNQKWIVGGKPARDVSGVGRMRRLLDGCKQPLRCAQQQLAAASHQRVVALPSTEQAACGERRDVGGA